MRFKTTILLLLILANLIAFLGLIIITSNTSHDCLTSLMLKNECPLTVNNILVLISHHLEATHNYNRFIVISIPIFSSIVLIFFLALAFAQRILLLRHRSFLQKRRVNIFAALHSVSHHIKLFFHWIAQHNKDSILFHP